VMPGIRLGWQADTRNFLWGAVSRAVVGIGVLRRLHRSANDVTRSRHRAAGHVQ